MAKIFASMNTANWSPLGKPYAVTIVRLSVTIVMKLLWLGH